MSEVSRPGVRYLYVVAALLVIAFGVSGVSYGEVNDSPGLHVLGVLFAVGAVAVRTQRRRSG